MTVISVIVIGGLVVLSFVIGAVIGWLVGNSLQQTREKVVLKELEREKGKNGALIEELARNRTPPPQPIDPAPLIRAIGEAITSVYNPSTPAVVTSNTILPTPSLTPPPDPSPSSTLSFFPDVEMDEWLRSQPGFPVHGGWINNETNAQTPPIDGQSPSHRVINGKVHRLDGQPLFQAGEGITNLPTGEFDG